MEAITIANIQELAKTTGFFFLYHYDGYIANYWECSFHPLRDRSPETGKTAQEAIENALKAIDK